MCIRDSNKLEEVTQVPPAPVELQPAQIKAIFQSLVATRGKGGDNQQVAKKVQAQLTPLFAKITSNEKLNGLLAKVGNAVPIEGIKKMVAGLPEPAGSKASQIVSQINAGAKQIQDDQDLAAFKGLMLTVIGIALGAAGAGGPALLGIMGTTAIFRTVVDSAITAAAGGTVADTGKAAAKGFAAGAIAGLVGDLLGGVEVSGDENLSTITIPPAEDVMSQEEIDAFIDNMKNDPSAINDAFTDDNIGRQASAMLRQANVGPEYADKLEGILRDNTVGTMNGIESSFEGGSSLGVLFNEEEFAEYNRIVADNGGGTEGIFSDEATAFRQKIAQEAGAIEGGVPTDALGPGEMIGTPDGGSQIMSPDGTVTITGADGSTEVIEPPKMPVQAEFDSSGKLTNLSELQPGTYTTELPNGNVSEIRVEADFDDPDVAGGYSHRLTDADGKLLSYYDQSPTSDDFGGASEVGEVPAEDPNAPQEVAQVVDKLEQEVPEVAEVVDVDSPEQMEKNLEKAEQDIAQGNKELEKTVGRDYGTIGSKLQAQMDAAADEVDNKGCLLYTSPSPRD